MTAADTEDRQMRLADAFSFTDARGTTWMAPKDALVDGASIPRALWSVIGSPYTGDYRRASIVHDVACVEAGSDRKKRRAADRMFYRACRAGGCSIWQAIVLYLGVRIGAAAPDVPEWREAVAIDVAGPRIRRTESELQLERDFQSMAEEVLAQGEADEVSVVERRVDRALARTIAVRQRVAQDAGSSRRARRG